MNLIDPFFKTVSRQPHHAAIIGPGDEQITSYGQLGGKVRSMAARLASAGLKRGDCVGLHYASGRDYITLTYAVWCCGASVIPIAVELAPEEKQLICKEICMNAVITTDRTTGFFAEVGAGDVIPIVEDIVLVPARCLRRRPQGFAELNAAFLRFTSGTTGSSKGVILSHQTIFDRISAANRGLQLGPEVRVIWLLSMSYHFAVSIVAYLSFGASMVLCKNHFGGTIVKAAAEHRGTLIYGSPVHYELMAHDKSGIMLPHLRLAISTAASLSQQTADAFYRRFEKPINQAYGIIEVGLPCINLDAAVEKSGSVGRPLPDYELRTKNVGLGENLKAIQIRGKGILDAYYDPWMPRLRILEDGWFSTGDLGKVDQDGYLFILGRSKEMINVGGMKFFPQEVEVVLESHPAVKEACVFGHEHERFGEIPYAQVVRNPAYSKKIDEQALSRYCAKRLTAFKRPERLVFVEELARTASGKVIRQKPKRVS